MSESLTRIAVVGKMHSGKTTFANHLVGMGFERVALADALKDDIVDCLNYLMHSYGIDKYLDRKVLEQEKAVFRPFMQWLGTEFFRVWLDRPEHWINELRGTIRAIDTGTKMGLPPVSLVCDDVRFPNEAQALRDLGFTIVKIERPEDHRKRSVWKQLVNDGVPTAEIDERMQAVFSHVTENLVNEIDADIVIENIGVNTLLEEARRLTGRPETRAQHNERIMRSLQGLLSDPTPYTTAELQIRTRELVEQLRFDDEDLTEFKRRLP